MRPVLYALAAVVMLSCKDEKSECASTCDSCCSSDPFGLEPDACKPTRLLDARAAGRAGSACGARGKRCQVCTSSEYCDVDTCRARAGGVPPCFDLASGSRAFEVVGQSLNQCGDRRFKPFGTWTFGPGGRLAMGATQCTYAQSTRSETDELGNVCQVAATCSIDGIETRINLRLSTSGTSFEGRLATRGDPTCPVGEWGVAGN